MTTNTTPSTASQAPEVTIDTPEFARLLLAWHDARVDKSHGTDVSKESDAITAYVKAKIEEAVSKAREADQQAMLDMLGWYHPYERPETGDEFKTQMDRFLNYATDHQQPYPVPDQAAIIWRRHLLEWRFELAHLRSVFKSYRSMYSRATAAEAKLEAIRQGVEGLTRWDDNLGMCPVDYGPWIARTEVLSLLQPQEPEPEPKVKYIGGPVEVRITRYKLADPAQPQADESGLPG